MIFFNFVIHLSLILETFVISWNALLIISFCDIVYTQHNWFWKYLIYLNYLFCFKLYPLVFRNFMKWTVFHTFNNIQALFSVDLSVRRIDCPLFLEAAVVMIVWYIYNDLHNQCLSPLKLWVQTPFIPEVLVTCDRSVVFSGFLHQ